MKILKVDDEQHLVGGVVYSVDTPDRPCVDSDGEFVDDPAELLSAMKTWAAGNHVVKIMHSGRAVNCPVVESFLTEDQEVRKAGGVIPPYSWYICVHVPDDRMWAEVRDGELWKGWSMAGVATAEEVEKAGDTSGWEVTERSFQDGKLIGEKTYMQGANPEAEDEVSPAEVGRQLAAALAETLEGE